MATTSTDPVDCPSWWHFSHEADIGVAGCGRTLAEAFAQTALAMTRVITEAPVAGAVRVAVRCRAPDPELLLVEWLNALVFEMATRRLLFGRFDVRIDGDSLEADAWGEPVDRARHSPAVEVKGATYTALEVARNASGHWIARCVIDV
jgi:SHS2 domain-containing protein